MFSDTVKDNKLSSIDCTIEQIEELLSQLKSNKSPGPDVNHTRILKDCSKSLAPTLCYLFNRSFQSGIYTIPNDWKLVNILYM